MSLLMIKILVAVLVFLPATQAWYGDTNDWVSIDCGAETTIFNVNNTGINWVTDASYTETGINHNVSVPDSASMAVNPLLKTLRSFPVGVTNCYSFNTDTLTTYLVRARFYYGNYDGQSKPPTFDISVNGFKWATIAATSAGEDPVVIEGLFMPAVSYLLPICLVRGNNSDDGVTFISSLEVTPLPSNRYMNMDLYSAFILHSRINFGGEEDISYNGDYSTGDQLNLIWKAEGVPGYRNVSSNMTFPPDIPNQPPNPVLRTAIEASNPLASIIINLDLHQNQQPLCIFLYFVELNNSRLKNDTRKFRINVGDEKNLSTIDLRLSELATLYPQRTVNGSTNITISPVEGSSLPPILNAMEVYTIMDMHSPLSPPPKAGSEGVHSSPVLLLVCLFSVMVMLV